MNAAYPFLSVLAVGISSCAQLHEKLGGTEASRAIDRCLKRIERLIDAGAGRIVRTGDSEMIVAFDASDVAVKAAIEMQELIASQPPVSGAKMAIRVGISWGPLSNPDLPADNDLVRETAHLMGLAKSGQILVSGKVRKALPEAMRKLSTDTGLTLLNASGSKMAVVEIASDRGAPPTDSPETAEAVDATDNSDNSCARLRLHYGQNTIVLDEQRPVIAMGRDATCGVIIRNLRASRRHATIELRGSLVVLIDKSTNGTFVTIDGNPTQFVKHGECPLHGSGMIAFSSSSSTPDADCVRFECA
jgi:hypothetical protein